MKYSTIIVIYAHSVNWFFCCCCNYLVNLFLIDDFLFWIDNFLIYLSYWMFSNDNLNKFINTLHQFTCSSLSNGLLVALCHYMNKKSLPNEITPLPTNALFAHSFTLCPDPPILCPDPPILCPAFYVRKASGSSSDLGQLKCTGSDGRR